MEWLPLSELPRFFKQSVSVPPEARDKSALQTALVQLLEDYFSFDRLVLDHAAVTAELRTIREWRADVVLGKLRSLLEKQTRRDIQAYCAALDKPSRGAIAKALHHANIHHFRKNLETDLYVGVHTAISANFKMLGLVYSTSEIPTEQRQEATAQLLRALRCIATQPLQILIALDGLFWDSKLFKVPQGFRWCQQGPSGFFEVDLSILEHAVSKAIVDEIPLGCPAMRARVAHGLRAIDFVQERCLEVARRYYLELEPNP